jgi:hypothetical protein
MPPHLRHRRIKALNGSRFALLVVISWSQSCSILRDNSQRLSGDKSISD